MDLGLSHSQISEVEETNAEVTGKKKPKKQQIVSSQFMFPEKTCIFSYKTE